MPNPTKFGKLGNDGKEGEAGKREVVGGGVLAWGLGNGPNNWAKQLVFDPCTLTRKENWGGGIIFLKKM